MCSWFRIRWLLISYQALKTLLSVQPVCEDGFIIDDSKFVTKLWKHSFQSNQSVRMVGQWQRTSASGNTSLSITSSISRIIRLRSNGIFAFNCQLAEFHKVFASGWSLPLSITPLQVTRVWASRKMGCKGEFNTRTFITANHVHIRRMTFTRKACCSQVGGHLHLADYPEHERGGLLGRSWWQVSIDHQHQYLNQFDVFLQDNRRNVHVLRRNQLHVDRGDDRDVGRNMEHRLHRLEGRAAQGRRRQAGEAGLCQGQETTLAKLFLFWYESPRLALFRVSIIYAMIRTFTKLGLHLFGTKSLNQTWTPFICWEYKHSSRPDFFLQLMQMNMHICLSQNRLFRFWMPQNTTSAVFLHC